MTIRRDLLTALCALAALPAHPQQRGKVWRIGYLAASSGPEPAVEALREQLRKLGYVEGRTIAFEYRWAAGREDRVQELAAELVRLNVDVIVTRTNFVALAAKRATATIPIVMAGAADPVGAGVIASLGRPGGNVTGVTLNSTEIDGKRLQLLHEVIPKATRVATLVWDKSVTKSLFLEQNVAAAKQMGLTLVHQEVGTPEGLDAAFAAMQRARAQALVVQTNPFVSNHVKRILDLAVQHRLPAIYATKGWMDEGGLMYYGVDARELHRHAATYIDRLLRGAKPADLPVEQPTTYELVINLKTAKALGLVIPQAVLLRADEVIQ